MTHADHILQKRVRGSDAANETALLRKGRLSADRCIMSADTEHAVEHAGDLGLVYESESTGDNEEADDDAGNGAGWQGWALQGMRRVAHKNIKMTSWG